MANRITLDELLAIARKVQGLHLSADCDAARLANGIVDLLGEAQPCGFEPPTVELMPEDTFVVLPDTWPRFMRADEARTHAAMLLGAADEADPGNG